MNIKELAIGNKVRYKSDAGIYTIVSLPNWEQDPQQPVRRRETVIIDRCPKQTVSIEYLRPVEMHLEILTNWMGFTPAEKNDRYGGFCSPPMGNSGLQMRVYLVGERCFFNMNNFSSVNIKGVHHLQNLIMNLYEHELLIEHPTAWKPKL